MALAKDRTPCSFYGSHMLEGSTPFSPLQLPNLSSPSPYSSSHLFDDDHYNKQLLPLQGDDSDGDTSNNEMDTTSQQVHALVSNSPTLSSPSSTNSSSGLAFYGSGSTYHQHEEARSLIDFKNNNNNNSLSYGGGFAQMSGSFLSFQPQSCYSFGQPNDFPMWEENIPSPNQDHHHRNLKSGGVVGGGDFRVLEEGNCLQKPGGEWLYGESPVTVNCSQESSAQQQTSFNNKRPLMEDEKNMQTLKKQCTSVGSSRKQPNKPKPSANSTTKDPQSLAAKNRRERISERLKILQDLVPNGTKVDLVTMLEKAISYVKFLQLQVKVLATDEFWPAAGGGKLPDIAQVRDAIDAILSSQREHPTS